LGLFAPSGPFDDVLIAACHLFEGGQVGRSVAKVIGPALYLRGRPIRPVRYQRGEVVKGLSHGLDDATKSEAFDQLKQVLSAHETADGVVLNCAAWLITARRAS
jgi:hypothetical protein